MSAVKVNTKPGLYHVFITRWGKSKPSSYTIWGTLDRIMEIAHTEALPLVPKGGDITATGKYLTGYQYRQEGAFVLSPQSGFMGSNKHAARTLRIGEAEAVAWIVDSKDRNVGNICITPIVGHKSAADYIAQH